MSIIDRIFKRKRKPIEDIHHIYWDMMGGFTMMKPPTEEDYKKFKNVNIADMYPSKTLLNIINKIEALPRQKIVVNDRKLLGKNVDHMVIDEWMPGGDIDGGEAIKEYIVNDVKVTEEYYKLVNKEEETKMTKKQRIEQLEKQVEYLTTDVENLKLENHSLIRDLNKTTNNLRNLLVMVPVATTIQDELIYWVCPGTENVWRRFVKELICDKTNGEKYYMYINAKIIQDTPKYFVFSAVMWEDADAHRDGEDPIYMDYYRVNKADGKSEKININDYKDLADKLI